MALDLSKNNFSLGAYVLMERWRLAEARSLAPLLRPVFVCYVDEPNAVTVDQGEQPCSSRKEEAFTIYIFAVPFSAPRALCALSA